MKLPKLHRLMRRFSITALSLCFAVGTLSATYHACEMEPPATQEVHADMAGMNCDSMASGTPSKPKAEKQCCVDFSCPKCFSSPLTTARLEAVTAPVVYAAIIPGAVLPIASHRNDGIDRPPKFV